MKEWVFKIGLAMGRTARTGDVKSLEAVRIGFRVGHVTKDQYANTLREHQKSQDEMKSDARDKARAQRLLL